MKRPASSRSGTRYWERLRQASKILPADRHALRSRKGPFRPALVALASAAADERDFLLEAAGPGPHPAEIVLGIQEHSELGWLRKCLLLEYAQTGNAELVPKLVSVIGARRTLRATLGLPTGPREKSLDEYLAEHASASENGGQAPEEAAEEAEILEPEAAGVRKGTDRAVQAPQDGPSDADPTTSTLPTESDAPAPVQGAQES